MEKAQLTKIGMTLLILAVLAGIGFAVAYFVPDSTPRQADIMVEGDQTPLPSKLEEEQIEEVREDLVESPAVQTDKEEVREELAKPAPTGELSEAEKERIRAELRK
jgi:hypothetical protein